jgi:hypothetical protein
MVEDPEVHNDPATVREKALKMGANISYIFNNNSFARQLYLLPSIS